MYQFHVHRVVDAWRLVLRVDRPPPDGVSTLDWRPTVVREPHDVAPDVLSRVDAAGFCLFKIGGTFADVDADIAAIQRA